MSEVDAHAAFLQLQEEGWSLKEQEALELVEGEAATAAALKKAVLNADLKKVGKASLPDDTNRAEGRLLKGPHVLQLVTAQDISVPSQGGSNSAKQRMLLLKLTDGKLTMKGVEFKPFARLDPGKLPPGSKVVVHDASIKAGVVLLDDKSLQVLGGQVEALVDAWEFQRRFGTAERPAESGSDSTRPPLFTPFVPGKTHAPKSFLPSSTATPKAAISAPPGFAQAGASARQPPEPRQKDAVAGRDAAGRSASAEPGRAPNPGGSQDQAQVAVPDRARAPGIAKQKLLERLASAEEGGRGMWGRGERRGRGRRGRHDDDDDAGMTLAEWEAQQKGMKAGLTIAAVGTQLDADEALARQLQEELDMEDAGHHVDNIPPPSRSAAEELKQSLFAFEPPSEERSSMGRRGRGRGRGRGSSRRQAY